MKRAIQSFAFGVKNGDEIENVGVNSDDWYEDDHWIVKQRPTMFVDADQHPDVVRVAAQVAEAGKVPRSIKRA